MKLVIEKCTELGATDFFLIKSEYTNYMSDIERLRRVAIFASEQSERLDIPQVHNEQELSSFVMNLPIDYKWYSAIERSEKATPILEIAKASRGIGFVIGPEGGFSDAEKELLQQTTIPIRLSTNILRTETAAILCTAIGAMKHSI